MLARLAKRKLAAKEMPGAYPLEEVHVYLERQHDFAVAHGFVSCEVGIAIGRTLLYQNAGMVDKALKTLEEALSAAAPTGLLCVFLDECEPMQSMLEELKPRLTDKTLIAYANRLLEAFSCGPAKTETGEGHQAIERAREMNLI